jgi:hypothetical protein
MAQLSPHCSGKLSHLLNALALLDEDVWLCSDQDFDTLML